MKHGNAHRCGWLVGWSGKLRKGMEAFSLVCYYREWNSRIKMTFSFHLNDSLKKVKNAKNREIKHISFTGSIPR